MIIDLCYSVGLERESKSHLTFSHHVEFAARHSKVEHQMLEPQSITALVPVTERLLAKRTICWATSYAMLIRRIKVSLGRGKSHTSTVASLFNFAFCSTAARFSSENLRPQS